MRKKLFSLLISAVFLFAALGKASAQSTITQDTVCDPSHEDCRSMLIQLIRNEKVGIDWGLWFIKDPRYVTEIIKRFQDGLPIRIIMDPRANNTYASNAGYLKQLADAGIPMRKRVAGDICHWKLMVFAGQRIVEVSGANYSGIAFRPDDPYKNYEDEAILFTTTFIDSFETKFDDIWTNTSQYASYANISGQLLRNFPTYPIDPRLNFPPDDSYEDRLVPLIDRENSLIDVDMYRLTENPPVDALIRAAARGVRERLYFEPSEYTNTARPGNKVEIDKLVAAAAKYPGTIEIRMRAHYGLNHQKTVWLHGQHIVIYGTSNWSNASDDNQLESNFFTDTDPGDGFNNFLFDALQKIFVRKWYNTNPIGAIETVAYKTPTLPPPVCEDPVAMNYGGALPCAYQPDTTPPSVQFTSPASASVVSDLQTVSATASDNVRVAGVQFAVDGANIGTKISSAPYSMNWNTFAVANGNHVLTATATDAAGNSASASETVDVENTALPIETVVLRASDVSSIFGRWNMVSDPTAADGVAIYNPNAGQAKVLPAKIAPANYFEVTFEAKAGVPYHLWLRMKADSNYYGNDSVDAQFSDSVDASGNSIYRIGTTDSAEVVLQESDYGHISGWGWADQGWNGLGANIYFATSGTHTLRIQQREDGCRIDQIVLSPDVYLTSSPGTQTNDTTILVR
ncbi:MAG TPA: phospholipase D-like domain-containing protein [Patescibacteria group bacterium]|nr:phospholipase D-like domain-containing protein [Patescibacteria group bacterium]